MENKFEVLNSSDVICFTETPDITDKLHYIRNRFGISNIFEFAEFINGLDRLINLSAEQRELLEVGIPCRVMTTRQKGWQLGKIRLKLELQFVPDNLENLQSEQESSIDFVSPLDEIRNSIS